MSADHSAPSHRRRRHCQTRQLSRLIHLPFFTSSLPKHTLTDRFAIESIHFPTLTYTPSLGDPIAMTATMSPAVQVLSPPGSPTLTRRISLTGAASIPRPRGLDTNRFARTVEESFTAALDGEHLRKISSRLQQSYSKACQHDHISWLPSFCHTLPSGYEQGSALALDVGGSNLRVALVDMRGRGAQGGAAVERLRQDFTIGDDVRNLQGRAFFEWMAEKICEAFAAHLEWVQGPSPLPIGLSWSFPVE